VENKKLFLAVLVSLFIITSVIAVRAASCTETDGGKDYYTKGKCVSSTGAVRTDYCVDSTTVKEFYCWSDQLVYNEQKSKSGYVCKDGALVKEETPSLGSTKPTPTTEPVNSPDSERPSYCPASTYPFACEKPKSVAPSGASRCMTGDDNIEYSNQPCVIGCNIKYYTGDKYNILSCLDLKESDCNCRDKLSDYGCGVGGRTCYGWKKVCGNDDSITQTIGDNTDDTLADEEDETNANAETESTGKCYCSKARDCVEGYGWTTTECTGKILFFWSFSGKECCEIKPPEDIEEPTCGNGKIDQSNEECDGNDMGECTNGCDTTNCKCKTTTSLPAEPTGCPSKYQYGCSSTGVCPQGHQCISGGKTYCDIACKKICSLTYAPELENTYRIIWCRTDTDCECQEKVGEDFGCFQAGQSCYGAKIGCTPSEPPSPELEPPEKEPLCIKEGKIGNSGDVCCEGFKNVGNWAPMSNGECTMYRNPSFKCTNCGDGKCGLGEDYCNCPEDCGQGKCKELNATFTNAYGSECGDANYNHIADFCGYLGDPLKDGKVDFEDLMVYATNYGNESWCEQQLEKTFDPCNQIICTDSDGGKDYYVKGTTYGTTKCTDQSECSPSTVNDECGVCDPVCHQSETILQEFYCGEDGYLYVESYTCPNGCEDGACIEEDLGETKTIKIDGKYTFLDELYPNDVYSSPLFFYTGNLPTETKVRTLLDFDLSNLKGKEIKKAELVIKNIAMLYEEDYGKQVVTVHKITGPWESETACWNNQPNFDTTVISSKEITENGKYTFSITPIIMDYLIAHEAGLLLKAEDESKTSLKKFDEAYLNIWYITEEEEQKTCGEMGGNCRFLFGCRSSETKADYKCSFWSKCCMPD